MPKIFISYPKGTFSEHALDALVEEITTTGLECEKLPDTPYVRSNIWVYANEYASERVYHGGKPCGTKVISLEVNVVEGALDADSKKELIARFSIIVGKHAGIPPQERVPVYIVIRMFRRRAGGCLESLSPLSLCAIRPAMQSLCSCSRSGVQKC
jgi:phenylpyruvate tautomerase PptA (4-oxalocrotonate tautomerase family)